VKIASNKLSDIYLYYKQELNSVYDESELYAIFELVCYTFLNYSTTDVKIKFHDRINQSEIIKIYDVVNELKTHKPIQYILGKSEFYHLPFQVNQHTLIPRPETEELVDMIIKDFSKLYKVSNAKIIDIGTGSGCIPIALKKHFSFADISGVDISESALEIAIKNAHLNSVEVDFFKLDILDSAISLTSGYDVIVSNPPYVLSSEMLDARVHDFEPHLALYVENNDPILFYKKIIDFCDKSLNSKGLLYFELNPLRAEEVKNYADTSNLFIFTELIADMSGKTRFLKAQKK
jgi:release factor glutamine methyltransferase